VKKIKRFLLPLVVSLLIILHQFGFAIANVAAAGTRQRVSSTNVFEEVSRRVDLMSREEISPFSIGWVDFNQDNYQDLWLSSHIYIDSTDVQIRPKLYLNNAGRSFVDITDTVWPRIPELVDSHGTAWADYDNDGDQDLLASSGSVRGQGANDNALFRNEGGKLVKIPDELGLSYPLARGRSPLWLDRNKDGLLDVVLTSAKRSDKSAPTAYFRH
jgi:hypothetical protein